MERSRGVALILALLVLSFLTVLGGALLTATTIDIWISDNYKSATQSLYLAEAGIEDAREMLRASNQTPSDWLSIAAGPDRQLLTGDDVPLIASRDLADVSGLKAGTYEVWLRNDNADRMESPVDSNDVVTLASTGRTGTSRKTIHVTVRKGGFPDADDDPRLRTVAGLEDLAGSITRNATDTYAGTAFAGIGAPGDYHVVVVDGNLELVSGSGYGILLVRGELTVAGNITWDGLILVIGRGIVRSTSGVAAINGGLFTAQTLAPDGTRLSIPAGVAYTITSRQQIKAANRRFPYYAIATKEY